MRSSPTCTWTAPPGEPLGAPDAGAPSLAWTLDRALVGLCALQLGVGGRPRSLAAAEYTSNRIQFGRPLATFQGAALEGRGRLRSRARRSGPRRGRRRGASTPGWDATAEVLVAKWWASDGGQRVVHVAQHLHGGMGADIDYPVHRYFLWGKQIEDTLGGCSAHLARLGEALAGAARWPPPRPRARRAT